jgi:hypothetical protein
MLDYLSDPNIEERMACSLDCCVGNNLPNFFESMLEKEPHLYENIIGTTGLEMLRQVRKAWQDAIYYDADGRGFSQTPQWKEFAVLTEQLNNHIKDSVRKKRGITTTENP